MQPLSIDARPLEHARKVRIGSRETWLADRQETIGASEVPSLFGVAYLSAFQLFMIKDRRYQPDFPEVIIEDDGMILPPSEIGLWLEAPVIDLVKRRWPEWHIQPNPVPGGLHFVHNIHRASATPDGFIYAENEDGPGVIQVKTVSDTVYDKEWLVDHVLTPPVSVIIQTMMDAALSGCAWGYAAVWSRGQFGGRLKRCRVDVDHKLVAKAFRLIDDFWARVARDEPYDPDFGKDGAVIAALYADDSEPPIDLTGERATRIATVLEQRETEKTIEAAANSAKKRRDAIDNEIRFMLGNASAARLPDGRFVTAKTIRRGAYSVEPTSYRPVKVVGTSSLAAPAKKVRGNLAAFADADEVRDSSGMLIKGKLRDIDRENAEMRARITSNRLTEPDQF